MAPETLNAGVKTPLQRAVYALLMVAGVALWLLAVYLLSQSVQNSSRFDDLLPWVLLINIAGLAVMLGLIVRRLVLLVRSHRQRVTGSRLEARMVWMTGLLAVLPILVVFYFSVQFISRGIDSWFGAEIGAGLNNALSLSRTALDLRSREYLTRVEQAAKRLSLPMGAPLNADQGWLQQLTALRAESGASELVLLGADGRTLAISTGSLVSFSDEPPARDMLLQTMRGEPWLSLDPLGPGNYVVRIAVPVPAASASADRRILSATFSLERRLAELADVVENASREYAELTRARQPLKTAFVLSLTLVLVTTILTAIYAAFRVARHLVKPIEDLVAGTRAVAKGDFETRLPMPANDEMGLLVHSFNDMTQRLAQARAEAARSQQAVETERANLAVLLARLSSGVISLSPDGVVQVVNAAAASLLQVQTHDCLGKAFIADDTSLYGKFVQACRQHLDRGEVEWREQMMLQTDAQRCVLICACTALPGEALDAQGHRTSGHVIVFDDVTMLIQAQRDAAWGEVARRLAHEIKNPLTPIRLSAERLHQKLLPGLSDGDAQVLERATHTIVQQVDAMKDMVNAFSQYARSPQMNVRSMPLNELVSEIVDLYCAQNPLLKIVTHLEPAVQTVDADVDRIRQVLHNLITNSIEALEGQPDRRIEIGTGAVRHGQVDWVRLEVTDNGPGFTPDMLGRAFEPYATTKPKGTGLGLAIVRKIAEEHAGKVEAENRAGGARMVVEWPIKAAPHPQFTTSNNDTTGRESGR